MNWLQVNERGEGQLDVQSPDIRRLLILTKQDTRFMDFILRVVESRSNDVTAWEGSDDWIRSHFFNYLLSLLKTTRATDVERSGASVDFNRDFVQTYRESHNFRIWLSGAYCSDSDPESRHPFSGSASATDLRNGVERTLSTTLINAPESARRLTERLTQTSQLVSQGGSRLKEKLSSWMRR